jgi:Protein of unknown function (DUF3417)
LVDAKSREFADLPEELGGLDGLAFNLWWSWHPAARMLFKGLRVQIEMLRMQEPSTVSWKKR